MKFLAVVTFLVSSVVAADWSKTCRDEHIDPGTHILSADCDTGDGKGTLKPTSLDLNDCFEFTNNKLQVCITFTRR